MDYSLIQFCNHLKKRLLICVLNKHCLLIIVLFSYDLSYSQNLNVNTDYVINSNNEIQLCFHFKNNSDDIYWIWLSKMPRNINLNNEIRNYFFNYSKKDTFDICMPLYHQIVDVNCNHDIRLFYSFVKRLEPNNQFEIVVGNYFGKLAIFEILYYIRSFSETNVFHAIPALSMLSWDEFPFFQGQSITISESNFLKELSINK